MAGEDVLHVFSCYARESLRVPLKQARYVLEVPNVVGRNFEAEFEGSRPDEQIR